MATSTPDPVAFHRAAARWERCRAGFHQCMGCNAVKAQQHIQLAAEHDRLAMELEHQQVAA